jgi:hypothetical protein
MSKTEALTQALVLAITAPSEHQMKKALNLAGQLAAGLSLAQVEQCKAQAAHITGVEQ